MTTTPIPPAGQPAVVAGPARAVRARVRHPLGLPAGSVRAFIALLVLGLIWALVVLQEKQQVQAPPIFLYYLMFLIVGHFFASHGKSIAGPGSTEPSPLYLPRGSIRILLLLGFFGIFAWRYSVERDWSRLFDLKQPLESEPYLPFVLLAAFFLGIVIGRLAQLGRGSAPPPFWFQDIVAWISLLAVLGLVAMVLIHIVINPGLSKEQKIRVPQFEAALASIVSFYFGIRS
jgi:hypothetical protein